METQQEQIAMDQEKIEMFAWSFFACGTPEGKFRAFMFISEQGGGKYLAKAVGPMRKTYDEALKDAFNQFIKYKEANS